MDLDPQPTNDVTRPDGPCTHETLTKIYLAERDTARAAAAALLRERNMWARTLADAQDDARAARDEAEQQRARAGEAETEIGLLITRLESVALASDDGTEYEHNGHARHEGEPECPGCWAAAIRNALQEPR